MVELQRAVDRPAVSDHHTAALPRLNRQNIHVGAGDGWRHNNCFLRRRVPHERRRPRSGFDYLFCLIYLIREIFIWTIKNLFYFLIKLTTR